MRIQYYLFVVIIFLLPIFADGQCDSLPNNSNKGAHELITVVEEMPQYPGGDEARFTFFKENAKAPENWPSDSLWGKVFITFLVDKQGNIKFPCILRGFDPVLDSIALAAVKKMPKWIPAKQRGQPIECVFNLPISFGTNKSKKN